MSAADVWLDDVLDPGSFRSWDVALTAPADMDYRDALVRAAARSGADDAVRTGTGSVHGRRVAVIVSEFGFLGGSIGVATAQRIVAVFDRARRERIPVLAGLASGGTRMQEGAAAFLTMRTITVAVGRYRATGMPYLAHLRHPTTGGVYASWASLAHDVSAEPRALVGLLGPRVVAALAEHGAATPIPEGVQTAENLLAHGRLDAVVDAAEFRNRAARLLGMFDVADRMVQSARTVVLSPPEPSFRAVAGADAPGTRSGADAVAVQNAARLGRPALSDLIASCDEFIGRRGGSGELVTGWARSGEAAFLLIGQDRKRRTPTTIADVIAARQAMALAADLGVPVVAVADTSGAEVSASAEEAGLAQEVALTLAASSALPVPSVTLLLGEGTGAAAIALCGTDALLAVEDSWLAPLPLAGAAALLGGDDARGADALRAQIAERQRIGAASLFADGLIDGIVGRDGVVTSARLDASPAQELAARVLAIAAGLTGSEPRATPQRAPLSPSLVGGLS